MSETVWKTVQLGGIWLLSLIAAAVGGYCAVKLLFAVITRRHVDRRAVQRERAYELDPAELERVLRGGTMIGVLERLLITGGLLAGYPAMLGIVLAIKGLGRFPELLADEHANRAAAVERFIIGTLASFAVACGVGLLGVMALGKVS